MLVKEERLKMELKDLITGGGFRELILKEKAFVRCLVLARWLGEGLQAIASYARSVRAGDARRDSQGR